MTDIAALGFTIDSSQAKAAADDLNKMGAASAASEAASLKLTKQIADLVAIQKQQLDSLHNIADGQKEVISNTESNTTSYVALAAAAVGVYGAYELLSGASSRLSSAHDELINRVETFYLQLATGGHLSDFTTQAEQAREKVADLSQQLGVSVAAFDGVNTVAKSLSVSGDTASQMISSLTTVLSVNDDTTKKARDTLAAYGINVNQYGGQDAQTVLFKLADAQLRYRDSIQKTNDMMVVFGQQGGQQFLKGASSMADPSLSMSQDQQYANDTNASGDYLLTQQADAEKKYAATHKSMVDSVSSDTTRMDANLGYASKEIVVAWDDLTLHFMSWGGSIGATLGQTVDAIETFASRAANAAKDAGQSVIQSQSIADWFRNHGHDVIAAAFSGPTIAEIPTDNRPKTPEEIAVDQAATVKNNPLQYQTNYQQFMQQKQNSSVQSYAGWDTSSQLEATQSFIKQNQQTQEQNPGAYADGSDNQRQLKEAISKEVQLRNQARIDEHTAEITDYDQQVSLSQKNVGQKLAIAKQELDSQVAFYGENSKQADAAQQKVALLEQQSAQQTLSLAKQALTDKKQILAEQLAAQQENDKLLLAQGLITDSEAVVHQRAAIAAQYELAIQGAKDEIEAARAAGDRLAEIRAQGQLRQLQTQQKTKDTALMDRDPIIIGNQEKAATKQTDLSAVQAANIDQGTFSQLTSNNTAKIMQEVGEIYVKGTPEYLDAVNKRIEIDQQNIQSQMKVSAFQQAQQMDPSVAYKVEMQNLNEIIPLLKSYGVTEEEIAQKKQELDTTMLSSQKDWASGVEAGFATAGQAASNYGQLAQSAVSNSMSSIEQGTVTALNNAGNSWKTFQGVVTSVLTQIETAVVKAATAPAMNAIGGSGGLFSKLMESIGGGSSASTSLSSDIPGIGEGLGYAKGAAFGGSDGKLFAGGEAFGTDKVLTQATAFTYAGGTKLGVGGEAGPEAVMPLTRGPTGDLGVKLQGGSGAVVQAPAVTVNIHNQSGTPIDQQQTSQKQGSDGSQVIDVLIGNSVKKQVGLGVLDAALGQNYGIKRQGFERG